MRSVHTAEVHDMYWPRYNQSKADGRAGSDALQTNTFENGVQTKAVPVPFSAVQFPMSKGPQAGKKRPRSPGLKWYKSYDSPDSLKKGRILIIDYIKQGRMFLDVNVD